MLCQLLMLRLSIFRGSAVVLDAAFSSAAVGVDDAALSLATTKAWSNPRS